MTKLAALVFRVKRRLAKIKWGLVYWINPSCRAAPIWPSNPRTVAIITAYNESDIIGSCIGHLVDQGVEVYLLDNWSTDDTAEKASRWLGRGLIGMEKFPTEDVGYYSLRDGMRRKEQLALELGADWYIHHDADEFRESPWPELTLAKAIARVDACGYTAIEFDCVDYTPVCDVPDGMDVRDMVCVASPCKDHDRRQVKAWKQQPGKRVDLHNTGGHEVHFVGRAVYPAKFPMKHFPLRGQDHASRKVQVERLPRYGKVELASGWHIQYGGL